MGMLEKYIVGATGIGYLITGILQFNKGATANALIWIGNAIGQTGLWLNLK
jgi:hypothetical protein